MKLMRCQLSNLLGFLVMEGFFATGCAFPRATARSERESRAERSTTATHGESKPFAVVGAGADGSTEGR